MGRVMRKGVFKLEQLHRFRFFSLAQSYPSICHQMKHSIVSDDSVVVVVLRFYGPVNPMGSCRARSVYLTTRLLGRLSPPSG